MNAPRVVLAACVLAAACRPPVAASEAGLRSTDLEQRIRGLIGLVEAGPAAVAAVPALVDALRDPLLRQLAAWALGEIGPGAGPAVPALLALQADDEPTAAAVCIALGRIGDRAAEVLEHLRAGLLSRHPHVRNAARGALRRLG